MGHDAEARIVAIAFESCRQKSGRLKGIGRRLHWFYGQLAGYGYRPVRLIGIMLAVWLAAGALYWYAAERGVMAPSDPIVFTHPAYQPCRLTVANGDSWTDCDLTSTNTLLPHEYPAFDPFAYSLDTILPLVDLQQESAWGPMVDRPPRTGDAANLGASEPWALGWFTRLVVWIQTLFGWAGSLILVAIVSGLARRGEREE